MFLPYIKIFRLIFFLLLLVSNVASWAETNFRDYLQGKGSWMSHHYTRINGTGIQRCMGFKSIYVSVSRHCLHFTF